MLVEFSVLVGGSVRIGIFRRGDIFYISIGVVFLFSCLLRWPFFVFRWVVFSLVCVSVLVVSGRGSPLTVLARK